MIQRLFSNSTKLNDEKVTIVERVAHNDTNLPHPISAQLLNSSLTYSAYKTFNSFRIMSLQKIRTPNGALTESSHQAFADLFAARFKAEG